MENKIIKEYISEEEKDLMLWFEGSDEAAYYDRITVYEDGWIEVECEYYTELHQKIDILSIRKK